MSIASEIARLQQAKADLATSITNKGVTVPSSATLDDYPALVDQIQSGGLPYDSVVQYLESSGNYVDTGILASSTTNIRIWVQDYFGVTALEGVWLFGGRTANNNAMFGLYENGSTHKVMRAIRNASTECNLGSSYSSSCWVEMGGGTLKIGSTTHTYTNTSFTGSYNVILFGLNNGGTKLVGTGVKLGEATVSRGTTVLHLIPVRVGTTGKYFNINTGTLLEPTFIPGPDV